MLALPMLTCDARRLCVCPPSLRYNSKRSATVVAAIDSHVWVVDRATFRRMIAKSADDQKALIVSRLRGVPLLETMTNDQLTAIAECVHVRSPRPPPGHTRPSHTRHSEFSVYEVADSHSPPVPRCQYDRLPSTWRVM